MNKQKFQTLLRLIDEGLQKQGLTDRGACVRAKMPVDRIRTIRKGHAPKGSTLSDLARVLALSPEDLHLAMMKDTGLEPRPLIEPNRMSEPAAHFRQNITPAQFGDADLPVYASAEGGDGEVILDTNPIEFVARPQPLMGVQGAFSFYVVGESMEPAYEQGDILLIHPSMPPARMKNHLFVQESENGEIKACVKRLLGWTQKEWKVRQFTPKKDFPLPRSKWQKAYRIVGSYSAR